MVIAHQPESYSSTLCLSKAMLGLPFESCPITPMVLSLMTYSNSNSIKCDQNTHCTVTTVFSLLPAIFFDLPITRTFFDFPWRFELSGVDCSSKPLNITLLNVFYYSKGLYGHFFIRLELFICSDFLAESLLIRKLQG